MNAAGINASHDPSSSAMLAVNTMSEMYIG